MLTRIPHDHDAERSVLGAVMLDARVLDDAVSTLHPEDFHDRRHREAFEVMRRLAAASTPVDQVSVGAGVTFADKGDYLARLTEEVPTTANAGLYMRMVRDARARRDIIDAAQKAALEASGSTDTPQQIADRASAAIAAAAASQSEEIATSVRDLLRAETKRLERAQRGEVDHGLATGFTDLDERLGGMQKANLIIVAGRPAMGKTALASQIAANAAVAGAKVLFFSLEMSQGEVTQRLLSTSSRVDLNRIRYGRMGEADWVKSFNAAQRLHPATLAVSTKADLTILQLRSLARRWKVQNGGLDLVLVDYLQLMSGERRDGNREREVAEISRGLKALAMELQIPIVALAQLSRACEARENKRPRLSDLRESGGIEQDADAVLFVYREDYYDPNTADRGVAEVILGKNRNGQSGGEAVRLKWTPECTRFDSMAGDR
jgi:replicative DNA helicase